MANASEWEKRKRKENRLEFLSPVCHSGPSPAGVVCRPSQPGAACFASPAGYLSWQHRHLPTYSGQTAFLLHQWQALATLPGFEGGEVHCLERQWGKREEIRLDHPQSAEGGGLTASSGEDLEFLQGSHWNQIPLDLPHETFQRHPASRAKGQSVGKLPDGCGNRQRCGVHTLITVVCGVPWEEYPIEILESNSQL